MGIWMWESIFKQVIYISGLKSVVNSLHSSFHDKVKLRSTLFTCRSILLSFCSKVCVKFPKKYDNKVAHNI
jgi:hypothetical protein